MLFGDVQRILSAERFARFHVAAARNIPLAIEIYELNIEISECVFGVLHLVEVCIRNQMHFALSDYCRTHDWFRQGVVLPTTGKEIAYTMPMRKSLQNAIQGAGPAAPAGKVVAELTFGFWTSLLASRFQQSLWNPCLHNAFPNYRGLPRNVHRRMEAIQRLRNRVAHHERILTSLNKVHTGHVAQVLLGLSSILECVVWAHPKTGDWIRTGTRYEHARELLSSFATRGVQLL
jgi:hypothetical protein